MDSSSFVFLIISTDNACFSCMTGGGVAVCINLRSLL